MENLNFELKRILSIMESKAGETKPFIFEQETLGSDELKSDTDPKSVLQRVINTGCLTNKKGSNISEVLSFQPKFVELVNKDVKSKVTSGEPYLRFDMKDKEGNEGRFYLFGRKGSGNEGTLMLLQFTGNKSQKGETGYEKPHFIERALRCPEFSLSQSVTSDVTNLTADQEQRVRQLVGASGVQETGFSYTTKKPEPGSETLYEPVDLSTGKEVNTGFQRININKVDGLKKEFPESGKFFIWVDKGSTERKSNLPEVVETFLLKLGFTRQEPTDIDSAEAGQGTTLKEICSKKAGLCNAQMLKYANEIEGDRKVWPMNDTQRAEAEAKYKIDIKTPEELTSASSSGKRTRKDIESVEKAMATKDSCRSAIEILSKCVRYNNDSDCEKFIKASDITTGMGLNSGLIKLHDLVKRCDVQFPTLTGLLGLTGKSFEESRKELKKSNSKYSPYSSASPSKVQLEQSLTKSIRNTILEHIVKDRIRRRL
jgi:hypothetical protein